jgi:hypothetical protein
LIAKLLSLALTLHNILDTDSSNTYLMNDTFLI